MTDRDELNRALSLLADEHATNAEDATQTPAREALLASMRYLVSVTPQRLRQRRRRRLAWVGLPLVACLAVGAWWSAVAFRSVPMAAIEESVAVELPPSSRAAWIGGNQTKHLPGPNRRVPAHGSVRSEDQPGVAIRTSAGIRVTLGPFSRVSLDGIAAGASRSVLGLSEGKIRCTVPQLQNGEEFAVHTRDMEVVVHGTVFSVEAPTLERSSCVRVEEGLVEVRHATSTVWLAAGASYGCTTDSVPAVASERLSSPESVPSVAAGDAHGKPPRRAAPKAAPASEAKGTLGEESRLLAAALVLERDGARDRARQLFKELLARYPNSALAAEARAGEQRTRAPGSPKTEAGR